MKKLLISLFACIVAMPLLATESESHDNRLYFDIGECDDLSLVPITLYLENPSINITAFEMYLSLPEETRITTIESTSRSKTNHEIIIGGTLNGLFVSVASENMEQFEGVDGAVCTIYCNFEGLANGSYTISSSGAFAVGVADDVVTCYTTANQEEEFTKSDNGVTGIKSITPNASNGSLEIYNIQGIRMNKPQKGQINIINGKKVIL